MLSQKLKILLIQMVTFSIVFCLVSACSPAPVTPPDRQQIPATLSPTISMPAPVDPVSLSPSPSAPQLPPVVSTEKPWPPDPERGNILSEAIPNNRPAVGFDHGACRENTGRVESINLGDSGTDNIPSVQVYLPPCYSQQGDVRYPVLYLLHGMNNNSQQWLRIGAPAAADELITARITPPFLIIMPLENNSSVDPNSSTFSDDLSTILVPWIDAHFATCTLRECRAIGGLSRGSGWALRIGLMDWQLFGAIGAHSVSPFYGDAGQLPGWLMLSSANQHPRIYLDIGTYDQALPDAQEIEQTLSHLHVPHEWHLFEGAHNEDYWHAHVKDYLVWYAEGFQKQ